VTVRFDYGDEVAIEVLDDGDAAPAWGRAAGPDGDQAARPDGDQAARPDGDQAARPDGDHAARPVAGEGRERGSGIPGMRQRAAALGGSVEAGPRPEGGFRVAARLPVPAP
jgi:hypothetical protein